MLLPSLPLLFTFFKGIINGSLLLIDPGGCYPGHGAIIYNSSSLTDVLTDTSILSALVIQNTTLGDLQQERAGGTAVLQRLYAAPPLQRRLAVRGCPGFSLNFGGLRNAVAVGAGGELQLRAPLTLEGLLAAPAYAGAAAQPGGVSAGCGAQAPRGVLPLEAVHVDGAGALVLSGVGLVMGDVDAVEGWLRGAGVQGGAADGGGAALGGGGNWSAATASGGEGLLAVVGWEEGGVVERGRCGKGRWRMGNWQEGYVGERGRNVRVMCPAAAARWLWLHNPEPCQDACEPITWTLAVVWQGSQPGRLSLVWPQVFAGCPKAASESALSSSLLALSRETACASRA